MSSASPFPPGESFLLDLVQVAVVALDRDGRVRLINRKGCEILGYETAEIVGRDWFAFIPRTRRDATKAVFRQLMAGQIDGAKYYENPVLTKGGEERIIAWHNVVLRDEADEPTGTLSSGQEVTDLRRSTKELEDIRYALDQAAIVAITDQHGIIHYVNDKFCEISQYSRNELLGQDHRLLNSGYHSATFMRGLWRTIARGEVWTGQIRNRAKDGTFYWVDTTIVPFLDDNGKPYQYLAIRTDITKRKKAEDELREREALAQLGQMAAVVAHEVKNPLAGIGGAIQIIGSRLPAGNPDRHVIGNILERIDALNHKVEDLLAFSRPKPPRFTRVSLRPLLEEVVAFLSQDPLFLEVDVAIDCGEAVLSGDLDMLRDVFVNLLLNAAQAMQGAGRLEISAEISGNDCRIQVRDDGPGIEKRIRGRIFEPFFSTRHTGTGLGLPIAKRVVENHGGSIRLHCPETGGTNVCLVLPWRRGSEEGSENPR